MVQVQKSYKKNNAKLYIVPTPIGNLDDMTIRAIHVLKEADLIACEDTRQTKKLLNHFEIGTPLVSYHEHNKFEREESIIKRIKEEGQTVALVSDAGMPIISDPGYELVKHAREEAIDVITLPGANAALTALVGSGLVSKTFTFYGFLPRKKNELIATLKQLGVSEHTLIFYESPHRVKNTLKIMNGVYSADRYVTIARELTKKYEEYVYGQLEEVVSYLETDAAELRGEFCIIVEGRKEYQSESNDWWKELTIIEHVNQYVDEGLSSKDAIKKVASDRQMSKREVYQIYHQS